MDTQKIVIEYRAKIAQTVKRTLRALGGGFSSDDASDCIGDVVLAFLDSDRFSGYDATRGASIATYVVRCTRNEVIDWMRYQGRRAMLSTDVATSDEDSTAVIETVASGVPSTDAMMIDAEMLASVKAYLSPKECACLDGALRGEVDDTNSSQRVMLSRIRAKIAAHAE